MPARWPCYPQETVLGKNAFPAELAAATVRAVADLAFRRASNPSPNSCLPESGNSFLPSGDKDGLSLVRTSPIRRVVKRLPYHRLA